ncbi:hypothetical protein KBB89_01255 [Candidatus Gracilibacteria bacterium]|nr:hypothetical protein [Candidatus Gracilibacteria bacterium]
MVTATLEIAEKKIQFSGLEELRLELRKQAKNNEYLAQFETTIDEALKQNDKDGIIEFTENEWRQLIKNENLAPVEEVKELLKSKITAMKEVAAETKEKTGGLAEEFNKKIEEVKKGVTERVDDTKEKITAGITETLSPLQKIKKGITNMGTKVKDFFSGIGTTFKLLFFTLGAFLGFKGAKEALATMTKEKAEKIIAEGKEKVKEGEKEEGEKITEGKGNIFDTISRTLLGSAAVTGLMQALPASVRDKLGAPSDGKNFLMRCAGSRFLRMCGASGLLLFGLGSVAKASEDPEIIAKIGTMPSEPEAQKTWIKQVLEYCGDIGRETKEAVTGALSSGWDIANGSKLSEYLESKKEVVPEGMVTLADKLTPTAEYLDELEFDIEKYGKQALPILATLAVVRPELIRLGLSGTFTGIKGATAILGMVGHNLISTAMIFAAVANGTVFLGHKIYVPEDNAELADWFRDIIELPEIRAEFEKQGIPTDALDSARDNIGEFVDVLSDEEALQKRLEEEKKRVLDKIKEAGVSLFAPEREQVIHEKTKDGILWFEKNLEQHLKKSENPREKEFQEKIKKLAGDIKGGKNIEAGDIASLMTATQGTNIRINDNWNGYIRWVILDDAGIEVAADFLCTNPKLEDIEQYHKSRKMAINSEGLLGNIGAVLREGFFGRFKSEMTELGEAMEKNNTKEGASAMEKFVKNGGTILVKGGQFILWDGLTKSVILPFTFAKNALDTVNGGMTAQELLVETTDGLAPLIIIGAGINVVQRKRFGILRALISSPLYLTGGPQAKMGGMIYNKLKGSGHGLENLLELFADRKLIIEANMYEYINRSRSKRYAFGGIFSKNMKELGEIAKDLADSRKVKKNIQLAASAEGRSNSVKREKYIKEAKKEAQAILDKITDKNLRAYHPLKFILNLPDTADLKTLDGVLGNIDAFMQSRTARSAVIHGVNTNQLRNQAQSLLNLPSTHPSRTRMRKAGGIAALIVLLATPVIASAVAEKKNNKESANEGLDDLGESYETVDYGGFESDIPASERIDNHAPEMRNIFGEIDKIKDTIIGENDTETTKLFLENNLDFYRNADEKSMRKILTEIQPRYEASVNRFRKLCQQNKHALEKYFLDNPEKQKQEIKVCAFLGATWNDGKINMRYMSREKFERYFYSTFDHIQNNLSNYEDDGIQSGWEKTGEVSKNLTPGLSSWIDTKQAYKDFSRGHIKPGLFNTGMAALGWTSDVLLVAGILTSWTGIGGVAGVGGGAAIRGGSAAIKASKVAKGIIITENIGEVATQTAQGIYLAVEKDMTEII